MKINSEIRKQVIQDYKSGKYSYAALAAKYGISGTSVGRIVNPEYQAREREKSKIRQRSYEQPSPSYSLNLRFYDKDQPLIDKLKSVDNKQQYIRDLIRDDLDDTK